MITFTNVWDDTLPLDTESATLICKNDRDIKVDVSERMSAYGAGLSTDKPAPEAQFGSATYGVTFFETDTGKIWRNNGNAWVDITSLFFPSTSGVNVFKGTNLSLLTGTGGETDSTVPASFVKDQSVFELEFTCYFIPQSPTAQTIQFLLGSQNFVLITLPTDITTNLIVKILYTIQAQAPGNYYGLLYGQYWLAIAPSQPAVQFAHYYVTSVVLPGYDAVFKAIAVQPSGAQMQTSPLVVTVK